MMRAEPPSPLGAFQDAFAAALAVPDRAGGESLPEHAGVAALVAQPGFAVYRNTVMKGCVDALQANYPSVSRLVGDEWFRAAAVIHARAHPPQQPALVDYGAGFADFLAAFEPARQLPYLAAVARLDRFWTEAHLARDEVPVPAEALAHLDLARLAVAILRPHASARWAWFDDQPIASIWQRSRRAAEEAPDTRDGNWDLRWRGEGILIVRPEDAVRCILLEQPDCAFLDACAAGGALAEAALAALAVDAHADLSALIARMLDAGAFGQLALPTAHFEEVQ